ncbi:hypothetical protein D3C77_519980 [compost metagenome]
MIALLALEQQSGKSIRPGQKLRTCYLLPGQLFQLQLIQQHPFGRKRQIFRQLGIRQGHAAVRHRGSSPFADMLQHHMYRCQQLLFLPQLVCQSRNCVFLKSPVPQYARMCNGPVMHCIQHFPRIA